MKFHLLFPTFHQRWDESENDQDNGDEGSGQQSLVEDGYDGTDSGDGNDRASNPNSNSDNDLETTIPSVLPFPVQAYHLRYSYMLKVVPETTNQKTSLTYSCI